MTSSGYFFPPEDVKALKYHDLLKKLAGLFAGLGHLQPLLLATTNSHYLLDRFCMERCCSSEYISRIVTSIIFMEILSIIVVRIVLYMVFKDHASWSNWTDLSSWLKWSEKWQTDNAKGETLNEHNKTEEKWRGIVGSIILCLITIGYIQILISFLSGGKKGHMHWFYASLLFQHFLNSLIAGSIGFWDVGLALWYLVTLPMAPIIVFFYQLIIHSWIRNNGPRDVEYIVVEYQIWLALLLSGIAAFFWIYVYCQPITPIELDLKNWETYKSTYENTEGYYTYSITDTNNKRDIWAGGKCLYASKAPATSTNPTHLYLEIASGNSVQKKYYEKKQSTDQWKEHTKSSHIRAIDLTVNGVLGMIISDTKATNKFRVSIRDDQTDTYINGVTGPKVGLYRAYSYTPGSGEFNIHAFIKPGTNGCETLKNVGPSTQGVKEVLVYTCLNHTPLLIYYGDGPGQTTNHNWFKNTGKDNTWKSAAGGNDGLKFAPPKESGIQDAQNVRNVLEKTNCLVNGIVQIDASERNANVPYCHTDHNGKHRINVSPYPDLLEELKPQSPGYTVFEHTPNGSPTLTISAFRKDTNYLNGIGGTTDSYITGVTRVVVFLNNSHPCLIYYERPNVSTGQHNWYKKSNIGTSRWTEEHRAQLQDKSPEDVARNGGNLQSILQTITGDDNGATDPDSNVTQSTGTSLTLSEGTPTDQYNRDYHPTSWRSWTLAPLVMQGLSVGAVGSIFPNLIPKTLVCPKTTRTLSVINMFMVTVPHIINVLDFCHN